MSANPSFAAAPKQAVNQVTTANTNRDGSGSVVQLVQGGANGSRIERLRVTATITTTAGCIRWYLSTDNGATKRLLRETLVPAITANGSGGVAVFMAEEVFPGGLQLQGPTHILYASTEKTETFNVFAEGGDC